MDEKETSGQQPGEKKPKKKKRGGLRRAVTALIALLLVAAALLAFFYRDRLGKDALRSLFGGTAELEETSEAFTYETGSGQTFALAGDGLAVASTSAVQLLDGDGLTVYKEVVSLDTPAAFGSRQGALFCDIGGKNCIFADNEGNATSIMLEGNIISAAMNASGWFTVITEEAGYKGLVQVYNSKCELIYKWWSGSAYALKAEISPDNKLMAVLCADTDGSALRFFSLASEDQLAEYVCPGDLLFDMYFMGTDRVCAISEDGVYFVGTDGALAGLYDMEGRYITDYDFGSTEFAALCLNVYRTGTGGDVITLDKDGNVLGTAAVSRDVTALSASGRQLLVMTSGDISLYSQAMLLTDSTEELMTAKGALLRGKGDALLLSAYSAELFGF